ncbi:enoyl- hydratase [Chlorella sorokiniana]|uniref:Enoyl-hydratase n=1 Tax=Chlorella sorokiniana TaxID=3076 RepID=A0A2P6TKG6_CHLSO|nr:enoyl- hydratase [Chlorella sorokiniana]|eukprot:PRW44561.1 enoyl- hydratase [Chlorella sorokiniana]
MWASSLAALRLSTLRCSLEQAPSGGAVLAVQLNRPGAFNAVSMELLSELHSVLDLCEHPKSMLDALPADFPRVIVLSGARRAFCGGVDIKAADQGIGGQAWDYRDMRSQQLLSRLIERMRALPQPIVCAVQGAAAGAGFALAMASDVRIASRDAKFSAAFVRLGLTGTDMGTSYFLWRLAGLGIASELLLTGRTLPAERAYQLGLVNELVDSPAELEGAAKRMAADMMATSRLGLQLTKEQLSAAAEGGSLRAAMTAENSHQILLVNNKEAAAVAQAWMTSLIAKGSGGSGSGGVGGGAAGPRSRM